MMHINVCIVVCALPKSLIDKPFLFAIALFKAKPYLSSPVKL